MNIWSQRKVAAQTAAQSPLRSQPACLKDGPPIVQTILAASSPSPFRQLSPASAVSDPASSDSSDGNLLASVLAQIGPPVARAARPKRHPDQHLYWDLPGFGRRCRIATQFGDLPIEALRRRDKVKTLSGAYREVVWVDEIRLDADFMTRHPEAQPVQLRSRALGPGQPGQSVLISPAQSLCIEGRAGDATAVPVTDLIGTPGFCRFPQSEMTYYVFHCGIPETVCIEGAWFPVSP